MLAPEDPGEDVTGYPIQTAKVQAPLLRDDTLARPRLLEWLQAKIHSRLVLLIAEAGYGKTTLLADFSRRTRLRTLWYRLDDTDRGWAPFIAHLVAAGREHEPGFAPATFELLRELGPTGPSREAIVNSFLRELPAIAASGAALVIDDFHLVDDSEEVGALVRDLVSRAPERLTIVIASRRRPTLPVARLRALGEVAELSANDLRFDVSETDRLFRDAYHHPLDAECVAELTRRTEGWVASLQLVQAAIRGRSAREARSFIRSLTGAEGDLYDYLAEEVIGHLSPETQRFLMRISLLETVDPELASVVAEVDTSQARTLIASAERFGLLSRRGTHRGSFRFHPLVRQFLQARVVRDEDETRIRELHRSIARAAEARSWYVACAHFTASGDQADVARVLKAAVPLVMATGQYDLAARFVSGGNAAEVDPSAAVILSRIALARDQLSRAEELARQAVALSQLDETIIGNLASVLIATGAFEEAREISTDLALSATDQQIRSISRLTVALIDASVDGNLPLAVATARDLARQSSALGSKRYEGIALLNAAELLRAIGRTDEALGAATAAQHALLIAEGVFELPTASSIRGWALARTGSMASAREELLEARRHAEGGVLVEVLSEFAATESMYGDDTVASGLIREAEAIGGPQTKELSEKISLVRVQVALRRGNSDEAVAGLQSIRPRALSGVPGREAWRLCLDAHAAVLGGLPEAPQRVDVALRHARVQGAEFWANYALTLPLATCRPEDLSDGLQAVARRDPSMLSLLSDLLAPRLSQLSCAALEVVRTEMAVRPARWRPTLRGLVDRAGEPSRMDAGRCLDEIGALEDVPRLRRLARSAHAASPDRALGKGLARRLARKIFVEDQGRVIIFVDNEPIPGRRVRRKVLSLLCFLLSRADFTAHRDEVLEAMWPEMDPEDALNSLNQTLYFLRRVFEPSYSEDYSPGYVHNDSELVWLDQDLIDSRSAVCARLLGTLSRTPAPDEVAAISTTYQGRFALDFAYEDWAAAYRDTQHAAYLHAVEEGIRLDTASGHFRRGIGIARRALAIDPSAQQIEQALLRLYRLEGAYAAAGEQYEHYSAVFRADLDIEPPPLESI